MNSDNNPTSKLFFPAAIQLLRTSEEAATCARIPKWGWTQNSKGHWTARFCFLTYFRLELCWIRQSSQNFPNGETRGCPCAGAVCGQPNNPIWWISRWPDGCTKPSAEFWSDIDKSCMAAGVQWSWIQAPRQMKSPKGKKFPNPPKPPSAKLDNSGIQKSGLKRNIIAGKVSAWVYRIHGIGMSWMGFASKVVSQAGIYFKLENVTIKYGDKNHSRSTQLGRWNRIPLAAQRPECSENPRPSQFADRETRKPIHRISGYLDRKRGTRRKASGR